LSPDDGGTHTFTDTGLGEITLVTPGEQMLTVMDTADNTITGSADLTVSAGPAPHGQPPPPSALASRPPAKRSDWSSGWPRSTTGIVSG
jgi:hypothetical protein